MWRSLIVIHIYKERTRFLDKENLSFFFWHWSVYISGHPFLCDSGNVDNRVTCTLHFKCLVVTQPGLLRPSRAPHCGVSPQNFDSRVVWLHSLVSKKLQSAHNFNMCMINYKFHVQQCQLIMYIKHGQLEIEEDLPKNQ